MQAVSTEHGFQALLQRTKTIRVIALQILLTVLF